MLNKFQAFTIIKLLILILVITGWPGLASLLPVSSFLLLREWVISWVLFCGNKDLKWQTNVTAHLQLRVLFSKQRIVHPWGGRAGRPQRRALNPSWVKFCLFELKWANHTLSPWNVKLECGNRDWNVVGIHLSWQIPLKRFTISSCLPRFLANA